MRSRLFIPLAILCALFLSAHAYSQGGIPAAFNKKIPETIDDLVAIEAHVQALVEKVMPATVCLRVGNGQGSGVIINKEGYILSAGHVTGEAGREVTIVLHDGRKLRGRTLGANNGIDSGMVLITDKADFPHVGMGKSGDLKAGTWCLSLGHPGGYKPGRPPVVRLGRLQEVTPKTLTSDCALVGGDSGGPLFDMTGRVIGIHSRIGGKVTSNVHVPIDTYHNTWDRLVAGEIWGTPPTLFDFLKPGEAYLGIRPTTDKNGLLIESVTAGSPAEKAGLKAKDIILSIDKSKLGTPDELGNFLKVRRPGVQISVNVQRGGEMLVVPVTLGKRTE